MTGNENIRRVFVGDFRLSEEEKEAIFEVLESGRISEGPKVREFEKEFASYIGTKHAVATSSGTAALITAITSLIHYPKLQIKRGTKVITTPLTYISTCNSIVLSGFEPVFVDVDPVTFGITSEAIEEQLKNTINPEEYSFLFGPSQIDQKEAEPIKAVKDKPEEEKEVKGSILMEP